MNPTKKPKVDPPSASADAIAESMESVRKKIQTVDLYLQLFKGVKRVGAPAEFVARVDPMSMDQLLALLGSLQAEEMKLFEFEKNIMDRHGVRVPPPNQQQAANR